MDPNLGEVLTRWTARVAVGCYVAWVMLQVLNSGTSPRLAWWLRAIWTAGLGWYLLHVASAFHFVHGWSHAAAATHTARRTAEVVGIETSAGLYVNYAFTLVWIADVVAVWLRPVQARAANWYACGIHLLFAFMMLNATVVFGPPFWRLAAAGCGLVAVFLIGRNSSRRRRGA